jgi:hypothetical protein
MASLPEGLADSLAGSAFDGVRLLDADDLTNEERAAVPSWFLESVALDGPAGILAATTHWENVLPGLLGGDLTQVPDTLRDFYTQIHNRFRVASGLECGLPPLDELFTLDRGADEYEYEGDADHHPEPHQLLAIFSSSNDTLCLELGTENTWMQQDEIIEPIGELWPSLDEWIQRFTGEMIDFRS